MKTLSVLHKPLSENPKKSILSGCFFLLLFAALIAPAFVCRQENGQGAPSSAVAYHTALLETMQKAESFDELTNALFCYEASSDSVTTAYLLTKPEQYRIPRLEPRLTSFSYNQYIKSADSRTNQKTLSLMSDCLRRFSQKSLTDNQKITCSLLQKHLELNAALADYPFYEELLGGSSGIQANLPVTLGEYPLRTEQDIKTYLRLLKQVPDYFEDAIKYEDKRAALLTPAPDFLRISATEKLKTLLAGFKQGDNSFIDTFNERISRLAGLSKRKQARYKKQNEAYVNEYVIPAYESLYSYLKAASSKAPNDGSAKKDASRSSEPRAEKNPPRSLKSCMEEDTPYGLAALPNGKEYYSLLVKSATGSYRPLTELISMVDGAYKEAVGNVLNIALTDQKAYLYYCENSLESHYQSPEGILEALSLMIREDYPLLKEAPSYETKTVSESLAASQSPAFYMIPAFDDCRNNTIYINPLYTSEENGNLFTTLAHEGFPGHLYQTVYFNQTEPDCIRQVLNYPGYVEGWATYAEINAYTFLDYPLEGNSLCRLYQADSIINLALSARIDLGVNYEGWTLTDTRKFFEDNGFNSYYAEDVYSYVVEAPANYLSYFIGYLEIMDLKTAYQNQEMENYSEKKFHQRLLEIGPADFETIRKCMLVNPGD